VKSTGSDFDPEAVAHVDIGAGQKIFVDRPSLLTPSVLVHEAFHLPKSGGLSDVQAASAAGLPLRGHTPKEIQDNASSDFQKAVSQNCGK
jgi:hypothetical protein